jgi:hypothetical protein
MSPGPGHHLAGVALSSGSRSRRSGVLRFGPLPQMQHLRQESEGEPDSGLYAVDLLEMILSRRNPIASLQPRSVGDLLSLLLPN